MQRALKIAAGFAPQFHDFIKQTPPTAVVEHGLFARPPETLEAFAEEGWGKGRVTLIGDAIHPARPTGVLSPTGKGCIRRAWCLLCSLVPWLVCCRQPAIRDDASAAAWHDASNPHSL